MILEFLLNRKAESVEISLDFAIGLGIQSCLSTLLELYSRNKSIDFRLLTPESSFQSTRLRKLFKLTNLQRTVSIQGPINNYMPKMNLDLSTMIPCASIVVCRLGQNFKSKNKLRIQKQ